MNAKRIVVVALWVVLLSFIESARHDIARAAPLDSRTLAAAPRSLSAGAQPLQLTDAITNTAIRFASGGAHVTFGPTSTLGAASFTLETWFKREGAGSAANTGSGGLDAVPLVTKGMHEADGSHVDANYFLGIDWATGALAADFEDMDSAPQSGVNHPVYGVTPITYDTWYHAAATFDAGPTGDKTWRLYLNGNLERELPVGKTPRYDSIQHAGLAAALNSTGATEGHFDGVLDEVRLWDYARTQDEIRSTINTSITTPVAGLVARWGLNEGAGAVVSSTVGPVVTGTLQGSGLHLDAGCAVRYPPGAEYTYADFAL